ncbi:hypothetical protein [Escherichia phage vB_EcoM_JNE01]|nr:hypothetical protein [Escherichia phage vB_EcoM_JNE01]
MTFEDSQRIVSKCMELIKELKEVTEYDLSFAEQNEFKIDGSFYYNPLWDKKITFFSKEGYKTDYPLEPEHDPSTEEGFFQLSLLYNDDIVLMYAMFDAFKKSDYEEIFFPNYRYRVELTGMVKCKVKVEE